MYSFTYVVILLWQQVENCGFVAWVDAEWLVQLKNVLAHLWGMYHDSNNARIDEKVQNGKMLQELQEEKNKCDKLYTSLLSDVNRFIDTNVKRQMKENYAKIMSGEADAERQAETDLKEMEKQKNLVANELELLRKVHKADQEAMNKRQKEWDLERVALKEEKKKLEHSLYELFRANNANKEKLIKIKAICDE